MPEQLPAAQPRRMRLVSEVSLGYAVQPVAITNHSALSVPPYKAAMRFLSDNLTMFPRSVRKDGNKLKTPHPLDRLLKRRPNGAQNAFTLWRTWFFHAVHAGDGFLRVYRDPQTAAPVKLTNLLPEDIIPFRIESQPGNDDWHQWYWHRPTKTALPATDVLHIMQLSHDGLRGIDPIDLHSRTLERAATLDVYQLEYVKRGTVLRGVIKFANALTEDQIAEVRGNIRKFRGGDAEDDVMILTDGGDFSNVTTDPQKSQMIEQAQFTTKEIAQMTGVDPAFLFERSETKYSGIVEAGENVVRFTFLSWIVQTETELTSKLLTEAEQDDGYTVHLNPGALLRGSSKEQMDVVVAGRNAGIYTANECREHLGQPRIEDPEADKLKLSGDTAPADKSDDDDS